MAHIDIVNALIKPMTQPYVAGRFIVVPTFMSYANGAGVQAYVEGGAASFVVSDGGGALKTYVDAGGEGAPAIRSLTSAAAGFGLKISDNGWIYSSRVHEKQLPSAISVVSECSVEAASSLARLLKRTRAAKDFKEQVEAILTHRGVTGIVKKKKIIGASQKEHSFDFAFTPSDGNWIVIDAVSLDANSINSAVVANLDVRQSHRPDVTQRIIYDDNDRWPTSELSLLAVGAPAIPFSTFRRDGMAFRTLGLH